MLEKLIFLKFKNFDPLFSQLKFLILNFKFIYRTETHHHYSLAKFYKNRNRIKETVSKTVESDIYSDTDYNKDCLVEEGRS